MATVSKAGRDINSVVNVATWRQYEEDKVSVDVFQGDLDTLLDAGSVWVESATSTNLPSGATQGIVTTRVAMVNSLPVRVQTFDGTNGTSGITSSRYKPGSPNDQASWDAWS